MADITKCTGKNCKLKESCFRYTSKANEYRQSYFTEDPIKIDKCDQYLEIINKVDKK